MSIKNNHQLDSSTKSKSLLVDFYDSDKKNTISSKETRQKETRQLGSTVLDRAQQIYNQTQAVRNIVSHAAANPTRFGCSVIAFVSGLGQLYSGDLISGGIATAVGAKELYNQACSGGTSTLHRLLSDINADVDMIRTLEEGQQQSYQAIEKNLILIRQDADALYGRLDKIKNLNTDGIEQIEKSKKEAYDKGIAAQEAYYKALELFEEAKAHVTSSKETYQKCGKYFTRIQEIAEDKQSKTPVLERIDALVSVAQQASCDCEKGKKELDSADKKFLEAMQAFSIASKLKDESVEVIAKVVQHAKDTLNAGLEKVEYTKECTAKIKATEQELADIKERSDDVMQLLSEMSEDVSKAKNEAQKKLDPSDVVLGVGAGVAFSSMGPLTAVALGVTSAYAWHNGTTIADTSKKVYNYFFGTPQQPPQPMKQEQCIRIRMDEKSSGYYGSWVKGRSSHTLGTVDVKLGDETVQFRMDLNQNEYPIAKEDLFTLYRKMHTKLEDKTLTPIECEEVLDQLERTAIDRGGLHSPARGLIGPRQAAYGLVKALKKYCAKLK